jgi:hypothetical protein
MFRLTLLANLLRAGTARAPLFPASLARLSGLNVLFTEANEGNEEMRSAADSKLSTFPSSVALLRRVDNFQLSTFILLAALLLASLTGCNKAEPKSTPETFNSEPSADIVARVHWVGKSALGIEANAYFLMRLWQLPENRKLEDQTLERLSRPPREWMDGNPAAVNSVSTALLPMLHDIVNWESYLQVRQPANGTGEVVLAIRHGELQAKGWATNFIYAGSVLGINVARVAPDHFRWALVRQQWPNVVELTRVGEWTIVGASLGDKNLLFGDTVGRIRKQGAPFRAATNDWLQMDVDVLRTAQALGLDCNLPQNTPRVSLSVNGDGANVITRGTLTFPQSLDMELEPWAIPASLIRQPLAGFTAIRGIRPALESCKAWNDLQMGAPPNQLVFWSKEASWETYMAAPVSDARSQMTALTDVLLAKGNPWLASHGSGSFQRSPDSIGATWTGVPSLSPFIEALNSDSGSMILGGLLSTTNLAIDAPQAPLPEGVLGQSNLVCFDWEATGPRIEAGVYIGQILRIASRRAQLPLEYVTWLRGLAPRLGICRTVVHRTGSNQLSFERRSAVGLSAFELQLLADWLASPHFPRGLHTSVAQPELSVER